MSKLRSFLERKDQTDVVSLMKDEMLVDECGRTLALNLLKMKLGVSLPFAGVSATKS